jgi:predicted XRE-type DNA-binding protein
MKIDTNYAELNHRASEIAVFKKQWPTIAQMLGSRIGEFEKRNAIALGIMRKRVHAIMDKHIQKTEDGKFYDVVKEEGKPDKWNFKTTESEAEFEAEYKECMEKPITIYL